MLLLTYTDAGEVCSTFADEDTFCRCVLLEIGHDYYLLLDGTMGISMTTDGRIEGLLHCFDVVMVQCVQLIYAQSHRAPSL